MNKKSLVVWLIFILLLNCSSSRMVIYSINDIIDSIIQALYEESDPMLAKLSIASNIKLLEGLIKTDPENEKLLLIASEAFFSYARGFIEQDDKHRTEEFYKRGKYYALRVLNKEIEFNDVIKNDLAVYEKAISTMDEKNIPALFWFGANWGGIINLNRNSPENLIDLPRVQAIMERIIEVDEEYYFGGAHLFLGIFYSGRPKVLGGDPEQARMHFQRAIDISHGRFLLSKVYFARYYAVMIQYRELFEQNLKDVINSPNDILPRQVLANVLAKEEAKQLLEETDELFY